MGQSRRAARREGLRALHDRRASSRRSTRSRRRPARRRSTPSAIASAARCSAITLAYLAAIGEERIASATLLAAQIDFEFAGDLKVFADADHIASVEAEMKKTGYLEGSKMATAFNLLRSNDLIWPYVVNNYLKGKEPLPFDLLYWNADATRMPAPTTPSTCATAIWRTRSPRGASRSPAKRIDLSKVTVPVYNLATREDHIAPAKSVFVGSAFLRRAGALRADRLRPHRRRGQPAGAQEIPVSGSAARRRERSSEWIGAAEEQPGSWWDDWQAWIEAHRRHAPQEEAPAGRRQAEAARGCAGLIRDGAGLGRQKAE